MNVGDYVRTDIGIGKYISDNEIQFRDGKGKATYRDIIKSSPNIIDLIEENDILKYIYNQKEYVSKVINRGSLMLKVSSDLEISLGVVEIKSILTHEQFENMEYKVGE